MHQRCWSTDLCWVASPLEVVDELGVERLYRQVEVLNQTSPAHALNKEEVIYEEMYINT